MILSYDWRLVCLSLAVFLMVHTLLGVAVALFAPAALAVALPHDAQAVERQERVDLRDRARVRCDQIDEAARADRGRIRRAELTADRVDDAVHLTGEAVDQTGLQRTRGRLPDAGRRPTRAAAPVDA